MPAVALFLLAMVAADIDWQKVQQLKVKYVSLAAEHAMEMQKTDGEGSRRRGGPGR